jgi:hypothetical protein
MKRTNIKLFQVDLGAARSALSTSSFDEANFHARIIPMPSYMPILVTYVYP